MYLSCKQLNDKHEIELLESRLLDFSYKQWISSVEVDEKGLIVIFDQLNGHHLKGSKDKMAKEVDT